MTVAMSRKRVVGCGCLLAGVLARAVVLRITGRTTNSFFNPQEQYAMAQPLKPNLGNAQAMAKARNKYVVNGGENFELTARAPHEVRLEIFSRQMRAPVSYSELGKRALIMQQGFLPLRSGSRTPAGFAQPEAGLYAGTQLL